jgi:hypothetical protein
MARSADSKEATDGVERGRLHDAVDRIMDGPGSSMDEWVVQVLADLGAFVRAACPALYYETGRVIAGVDRARGSFLVGTNGPRWRGASQNRKPNKWTVIGEEALDESKVAQPIERKQRVLAAVLHPIARVSHHPWLIDLAEAMRALPLGQDHPLLKRSSKGLHGYHKGMWAWQLRLRALMWAQRRYGAGLDKKSDALSKVASTFEVHEDTLKRWKREAQKILGKEEVSSQLSVARNLGKFYRATKAQIANGDPPASGIVRYLDEIEGMFNETWLQKLAREFEALPRK